MTKTIETKIRKITPWVFSGANEKFSHLEVYFTKEGRNSYKGTRGTRQQITEQLELDGKRSLDSNLHSLVGKKVRITKDGQTGSITGMKIIQPTRSGIYGWLGWKGNKQVPEYC